MKLGFLTNADATVGQWVKFAKHHNIEGVEVVFNGLPDEISLYTEIERAFKNSCVEPCAFGLWWANILEPDSSKRANVKQQIQRWLDSAAEAGTKIVVLGAGELAKEDVETNVKAFADEGAWYDEYSRKLGMTLAWYVGHKGNFINSPERLRRVIEAVPDLKLKLDPVGIMRNLQADPYDVVWEFGDRVVHFHAKDIYRKGNQELEPPVGMGDLQWGKFLAMLYHHKYNGYVVIEPHGSMWSKPENRWKHILLSRRHIEQFL